MDFQKFEILEDKINNAVNLITQLRRENQEFAQKNSDLEQKLARSEQALKEFQTKFEAFEAKQEDFLKYKTREAQLKEKIESMLLKLNSIEPLLNL
ncbi:cell division protein ZapB [candidate division KSB1 bacterium]|nr:cell division protein ZapB [candidate division KSB1 bacterium]